MARVRRSIGRSLTAIWRSRFTSKAMLNRPFPIRLSPTPKRRRLCLDQPSAESASASALNQRRHWTTMHIAETLKMWYMIIMNREESKLFFSWMVRIFIWASFFSPLIVGGSFYFPYIVPKTVFFQVVIELALFFYLLLVVLDKKYTPKLDGLALAVLSFFGVYVLASVFGVNPARSFFGTYERMLSVVNLAHFIALFFMARAVFTGARDWLWTFRAFLTPAVLVG